jgi:hypothetical protein
MATVAVACKLPHGLVMRVFDMVETQEPVMGGGYRAIKVARERAKRVTLEGWSHPQNMAPNSQIVGGFALTPNVDKEFWDAWLAQNAELDAVRNGLIFAHEKTMSLEAEARDKTTLKSGLERLDPNKLPRGIEKSDHMKKKA